MDSEVFSQKFKTISTWPCNEAREKIDSVISLINLGVKTENEAAFQTVQFALETVIPLLPVCELEEKLLCNVCSTAETIFTSTLGGIERLHNLDGLSQTQCDSTEACSNLLLLLTQLVTNFLRGCEHIAANDRVNFKYVQSFVRSGIKILTASFRHCQNGSRLFGDRLTGVKNSLDNLYKVTCMFLIKLNSLLTEKLDFVTSSEKDCDSLVDIVLELTKLSLQCLEEDFNILSDAWKCLMHFIKKYKEQIIMRFDLPAVVSALTKKLTSFFEKLVKLDVCCMGAVADTCERSHRNHRPIKTAWLLLMILTMIFNNFSAHLSEELSEVLKLLFLLYGSTPSYLTAQGIHIRRVTQINSLMVLAADNFLNPIFSERAFLGLLKCTLLESTATNPYGTIIFLLSLLKKVNAKSKREVYLAADVNLLELSLAALSACHGGMISGTLAPPGSTTVGQPVEEVDLYEVVLMGTAVFVLSSPPKEYPVVEETLLRNVLTADPWRALMASDLWCLVARYADAQICHSTLDVLIPAFEKLSRNRPEVINLLGVIRRLVPLCATRYLNDLPSAFPPASYPKFWGIPNSETARMSSELLNIVLPTLQNFSSGKDINPLLMMKVVDNLYILASIAGVLPADTVETVSALLADLLALNPSSPLSKPWWFSYIDAISSVAAAILPTMPPSVMLKILSCIEALIPNRHASSQKLSFLRLLETFAPVTIADSPELPGICHSLSSIFRRLLTDACVIVRESALKTFAHFASVTCHTDVISGAVAGDDGLQAIVTNYLQKKLEDDVKMDSLSVAAQYIHHCASSTSDNLNLCSEVDGNSDQLNCDNNVSNEDIEIDNPPGKVKFDDSVENSVSDIEYQPKRLKLDSSAVVNSTIERLLTDSRVIMENSAYLSHGQKEKIQDICKLLQKEVM